MPVIEKVSGGVVYLRSLDRRFGIGEAADVSNTQAAYLCDERGDFERVDGSGEPIDGVDGEDFSANGWLENDYRDRADAVREGGLDDYLDEIEAVETSENVLDAVDERRDELGPEA